MLKVENRNDLEEFEEFIFKIRRFLKSEIAKSINEKGNIVYNNLLLHHKHYYKIYKSYKWLNSLNDDSKKYYIKNYQKIKNKIFQFDVLSRIQFNTYAKVLPANLTKKEITTLNVSLDKFLLNKRVDHIFYKFDFKNIKENSLNFIQKYMHLSLTERFFKIENLEDEVFVDLFRLFPIARSTKNISFPIFVKQKEDKNIINANNTKVINLKEEFFTLPEILKTYDLNILSVFLENFKKYFKNAKVSYLLPDYIDTFKFTNAKKLINSYFQGKNIPKSVLAALKYLFSNKVVRNDILIYIQKNHENELFVTPLLIDFDKNLLSITNGLFIRRYPTKKVKKSNDIINYLKKLFDDSTAKKILNKCLQNGIKALYNTKTSFIYNNKLIYFYNLDFINPVNVGEEEVKALYDKDIFNNKNYKEITDDKFDNLAVFEKIIKYEKQGISLWKEYIPKLSLEVLNEDGIFEEFVLIDKNSALNKEIIVKKHFTIPANVKEISLPLKFEDVNIDFDAYITSDEMPFKENVECKLKLTYNYELENPFNLVFYPLKKYKPLKVKWKEKDKLTKLPFPAYPHKKQWKDFLDDNGSNLPEWILERLVLLELDKMPMYKVKKEIKEAMENIQESYVTSPVLKGKDNKYYVFVKGKEKDILCHESKFIENIDIHSLKQGDKLKFYQPKFTNIAKYIHKSSNINLKSIIEKDVYEKIKYIHNKMSFAQKTKDIVKAIHSIEVPLLKMWSNMSLNDEFVPVEFREEMEKYKKLAFDILMNKECDYKLKEELQFFLSVLHEDSLPEFYEYIVSRSDKGILYKNMAFMLSRMNQKWQHKLFFNIINQLQNPKSQPMVLTILAIAVWRDKKFINYLDQYSDKILSVLIKYLKKSFEMLQKQPFNNKNKKRMASNLELLLALIRLREKNPLFLSADETITQELLKLINEISKYIVENNIELLSKIELSIKNETKIPDLLYALNIYLRSDLNMAKSIKITGVDNNENRNY